MTLRPDPLTLLGCGRLVRAVAFWTTAVFAAGAFASWINRDPDPNPKLLRAACASRSGAIVGRRVLSMTSIPRGAQIVREIQASTEAELEAWAESGAVCP